MAIVNHQYNSYNVTASTVNYVWLQLNDMYAKYIEAIYAASNYNSYPRMTSRWRASINLSLFKPKNAALLWKGYRLLLSRCIDDGPTGPLSNLRCHCVAV